MIFESSQLHRLERPQIHLGKWLIEYMGCMGYMGYMNIHGIHDQLNEISGVSGYFNGMYDQQWGMPQNHWENDQLSTIKFEAGRYPIFSQILLALW